MMTISNANQVKFITTDDNYICDMKQHATNSTFIKLFHVLANFILLISYFILENSAYLISCKQDSDCEETGLPNAAVDVCHNAFVQSKGYRSNYGKICCHEK